MITKVKAILLGVFSSRLAAGLPLAILAGGALLTWQMVGSARRELCASQLEQARLVAQAMDIGKLRTLTGTESDTNSPVYLRLKEQLATVRLATPHCRFVSLLGQRADDTLFSFVDSEAYDSKDCSSAGQVYIEASEGIRCVFGTRNAATEENCADRRGKWISALVPIIDPQTVLAGMASPDAAKAMARKAVEFYRQNGRERFLKEANNPQGEFHKGDLYVFVYDRNMTFLAHPIYPELVGQNWIDKKDWAGGKYFRREIQEIARSKGHGWVEYEFENFASKRLDHKTTYAEGADDLIVCAGAYRGDGNVLAVLKMDVDANAWNWKLAQAALPSAMLTLTLAAIALIGSTLLARRSRIPATPSWWQRHLEPALVAATGLALSLFAGWLFHQRDIHDRNLMFAQLATIQSDEVAEKLRNIRSTGVESLAHFYEHSATVTVKEFELFTSYLTNNPTVQAWEWIPVVLAADKPRFEAAARADGLKGFEIWQKDAQGKRIPATDRPEYYPVFHLTPLVGNERALGYDVGSEPVRRVALETAKRTGLLTATDPITLVIDETANRKGMVVLRPVFELDAPQRLRGFALIVLRLGSVLRSAMPNNSVFMELALRRKDGTSESLANSWQTDSPPLTRISLTRPVLAFGKVFSVTAHAGPEFMRQHPLRAGGRAALTGLALTAALSMLISSNLRRREELERLVLERTRELRESKDAALKDNALLRSIMESPQDVVVFALDTGYRYTAFTQAHRETMKMIWDAEIEVGMNMLDVITSPIDREKARKHFDRALQGGHFIEVEEYGDPQLCRAVYEDRYGPISGDGGAVSGLTVFVLDITRRHREQEALRDSEALQCALLDNLPSGIVVVDLETRVIERVNNHVAALFGGTVDGLIGQQCQTIFAVCSNLVNGACSGCDIANSEGAMRKADGARLTILRTATRIQWQGRAKMLHCFVDVSERKQMEELLRQTHERLSLATRAGGVGIWDYDVANNKLVWDDQMFRHYGITRDQFGGDYEAWLAGIHPKDRQLGHEGIQLALRGEKNFNTEFRARWPDGSTHYLRAIAIVERDASGQTSRMIGTSWDITDKKQAEELLRERAALLEAQTNASPDGVLVIDKSQKQVLMNQRFIEMFDVADHILDDDDGTPLLNHIANLAKYPELFLEKVQHLHRHGNEVSRDEVEFKSGMVVDRYSSPVLSEYGKNYGRIWRFHDITEQKLAEKALKTAKETAEAATRAKSEFLANMSHEVRTPMNGVLGMVGLLLDTNLSEDQRLYANTANASGKALLTLLNDILDFSKMEAGKLEIHTQDFSLRALLDDFMGMMAQQAREKGLALGCVVAPEVPTDLQGDPGRLRQVLINLTGNAIKFTAQGKVAIRVSVVSETQGEARLRFAVRDTGIGIPSDKLARLFERFSQVDGSSTRNYGGTGLGLAISKQLTELMGGEIGVQSEDGKGSEFWFTVLLAKQPPKPVIERELATPKPVLPLGLALGNGLIPARILVVEDNFTNQQVAVGILKKLGFRAEVAVNGAEAVKALATFHYDLALMDVQMPVMDGLEATRAIRDPQSNVLNHKVPIIALTAHVMPSDHEMCLHAGMDDLINKPIERPALIAVLEKWLKPKGEVDQTVASKLEEKVVLINREKELAVFDRAAFMNRMMDDKDLARAILDGFLGELPDEITQLKNHLAAGDAHLVEKQAHKVKGACSTVAGEALRAVAWAMEQAGKAGDLNAARARITDLDTQFNALKEALNKV